MQKNKYWGKIDNAIRNWVIILENSNKNTILTYNIIYITVYLSLDASAKSDSC